MISGKLCEHFMAQLNKEMIKYLTRLCKIRCTEQEEKALLTDLGNILAYAEQLQEVDTRNVVPCNHVLEEVFNVTREDIIGETMSRETFLENAPSQVGGLIRVPPVIKQQS
jgi:aspartyl-tRNA(Asn)/glutamyl-tRNA(Gln) amidotransferase subunit C